MPTVTLQPKAINWAKDAAWIEITTSNLGVEPNLSLYAKINKNGAFLTELNATYSEVSVGSAVADFDLSGLALVRPEAPADGSMKTFAQGILSGVSCEISVLLNDMYGEPATKPESLSTSGPFVFIHGHTPYWYGVGAGTGTFMLHSYYDAMGVSAIKEIRKSQPEYVYLYSHAGATVSIAVEIIYTDGTNTTATGGNVTCDAKKVSWVNVGWDAMNCDAIVNPAKTVNSYIVKFDNVPIIYALDDHDTDYDQYILYDNGLGGCEVLRCSGRHSIGVEVNKTMVNKSRTRGSSFKDGYLHAHNVSGGESWVMQTGYQNQEYMRHIGQLFLAERVWYIDMFRETFHSVTVKETSAKLVDFENDLYNVQFTMTFDEKPSINTFNI